MSSTLEEVDGNYNVTTGPEEKDTGTINSEIVNHFNGDGCVDSFSGSELEEQEEEVLVERTKNLSPPPNGIRRDKEQELKFILSEYEHAKSELSKLQTDYKLSLEREKTLHEKLKDYGEKEDSSGIELSLVNDDLRHQLDTALRELNDLTDELKRYENNRSWSESNKVHVHS